MATEDGLLGPANRWYKIGFDDLYLVKALDQEIRILSAPCFLATKFEAYNDRGTDYGTSHDIEDIIYVIDNRTTIVNEIKAGDKRIRLYLQQEFQTIVDQNLLTEVLISHVHPLMVEGRLPLIEEKIIQILNS